MFFVLSQAWDKEKFWVLKINKFPLKCPATLPQGNFYYFTFYYLGSIFITSTETFSLLNTTHDNPLLPLTNSILSKYYCLLTSNYTITSHKILPIEQVFLLTRLVQVFLLFLVIFWLHSLSFHPSIWSNCWISDEIKKYFCPGVMLWQVVIVLWCNLFHQG